MTAPPAPPRLPVGQAHVSFPDIWRRVARPDQPTVRKVLTVAWPVVLTNLLASLALTVDLIFVGRLGTVALAATGVATQVFFVGMTLGSGLNAAATALVARAVGGGDREAADRVATVSLALAFVVSLPLVVGTVAYAEELLLLLGAEGAVLTQGALVLKLLALAIPGNMLVMTAAGALAGAGDTRPGLVIGILVNVVNLVGDWLLIFGNLGFPRLGVAGAAIATGASFTVGGLLFVILLRQRERPVGLTDPRGALRDLSRRLSRVAAPAALEQLLLSLGFTIYLVLILDFGADALAAHQIGLRVQSFAFMPGFGFAAAAGALVGQGLGRGEPAEAEKNGWTAITMGLVVMMALSAVMFLAAEPLARLFSDAPGAVALGATWIHVLVIAMPAIAFHFTAAGALRGAGDTRWPLLVSFAGLWLMRLPLAWLLGIRLEWGMYGIWAAYVIEYYARAVVTIIRFARGSWKTLQV